jgi:hypothetical protein
MKSESGFTGLGDWQDRRIPQTGGRETGKRARYWHGEVKKSFTNTDL